MTLFPHLNPQILAQSAQWLVVFKPAGMLTVPDGREPSSSVLVEWARTLIGSVWVTHRLDRETSGVVLFALTEESHRQASLWFQQRKIKKQYDFLASGTPSAPFFKVSDPIRGDPSVTQVDVKEKYREGFFGKAIPRTGRRHQIRIHLSQKGHSLWGDTLYKGLKEIPLGESMLSVPRVALHASRLELPTGEVYEAPLPEDFSFWLKELRQRGQRV